MNKTKTISNNWSKLAESLDEMEDWAENGSDKQRTKNVKDPVDGELTGKKRSGTGKSTKKSTSRRKIRDKEPTLFEDDPEISEVKTDEVIVVGLEDTPKKVKKENVARPKKKIKKSSSRRGARSEKDLSPVVNLVSQIEKIACGDDLAKEKFTEKPVDLIENLKMEKEELSLESFFDIDEEPLEIQWGKSPQKSADKKPPKDHFISEKKPVKKQEKMTAASEDDEFKKISEVTDINQFFADTDDTIVIRWGNQKKGSTPSGSSDQNESLPRKDIKKDRRPDSGFERKQGSDAPVAAIKEERSDWKSARSRNTDQQRKEDPAHGKEEKPSRDDRRENRREDRRENRKNDRADDRRPKRSPLDQPLPADHPDPSDYPASEKGERAFPSWDDAIVHVVKYNIQKHSNRKDHHKRSR